MTDFKIINDKSKTVEILAKAIRLGFVVHTPILKYLLEAKYLLLCRDHDVWWTNSKELFDTAHEDYIEILVEDFLKL